MKINMEHKNINNVEESIVYDKRYFNLNLYSKGLNFIINVLKCGAKKTIRKVLDKFNYKPSKDEVYVKKEFKEKKINLCIAKNCFIFCKGCYNNFCNNKEISYKDISDFLKYAKKKGLEKITLSGGDPLVRKDIKKIIRKCSMLKLKVNLDTVGLSLTKSRIVPTTKEKIRKFSNINILKNIDFIGIPLDGSNNNIISKFRIYKGDLFNEIIGVLEVLDKKNFKICINTVLHKENLNDIEKIYSVISKYSCVKKWQVFQFMPIGTWGKKNAYLYEIEIEDFIKARKKIEEVNKNSNILIDFKLGRERADNYILINSNGTAYKVNLENKIKIFGEIRDKSSWDNIINNLF